jgi:hypothetical protein
VILAVLVVSARGAVAAAATDPWQSWSYDAFWGVDRTLADPGALYAGDQFTVYGTTANHCIVSTCATYWVPRFTSPSLAATAGLQSDAMPDRPAWVAASDRGIWAPSVIRIGAGYVMYFAATAGTGPNTGLKCVGAAVSATPEGPFTPQGTTLACASPGYWALDPYAYSDGLDLYLLWREDDAANVRGKIVGAELSPDGLSFAGDPKRTLVIGEYSWENSPVTIAPPTGFDRSSPPAAVLAARANRSDGPDGAGLAVAGIGPIENPAMARHPTTGEWLLTWSANSWRTQDYATGLAVCDGPLGPCTRRSMDAPWLRTSADSSIETTAAFGGAGGLSFVQGPDDQLYAVFHAYRGSGDASNASRIAWAYRVVPADGTYRLVEF